MFAEMCYWRYYFGVYHVRKHQRGKSRGKELLHYWIACIFIDKNMVNGKVNGNEWPSILVNGNVFVGIVFRFRSKTSEMAVIFIL